MKKILLIFFITSFLYAQSSKEYYEKAVKISQDIDSLHWFVKGNKNQDYIKSLYTKTIKFYDLAIQKDSSNYKAFYEASQICKSIYNPTPSKEKSKKYLLFLVKNIDKLDSTFEKHAILYDLGYLISDYHYPYQGSKIEDVEHILDGIKYFEQGLKYVKKISSDSFPVDHELNLKSQILFDYTRIANIYLENNRYFDAIRYYERTQDKSKLFDDYSNYNDCKDGIMKAKTLQKIDKKWQRILLKTEYGLEDLTSAKKFIYLFIPSSISIKKNILQLWVMDIFIDKSDSLDSKDKYSSKTLYEFDYFNKKVRIISDIIYNKDDKVLFSNDTPDSKWNNIIPDTIGESLYDYFKVYLPASKKK